MNLEYFGTAEETRNVSGAIIFTAYVVAALLLTTLLSSSLTNAFYSSDTARRTNPHLQTYVQLFSSLAFLSFSILSYHMLSYLILSYSEWATERNIELPYRFLGHKGIVGLSDARTVKLHIWTWLKTSTLFLNFARTICESGENFWWTQQALFMTMGWSVFVGMEAQRRQISYLWAYSLLSQILPVSFAMSLFFLAILMNPLSDPKKQIWMPGLLFQLGPLVIYAVLVLALPFADTTGFFIPIIIAIRLLLFVPVLSPMFISRRYGKMRVSIKNVHAAYSTTYIAMALGSLYLACIQFMITLAYNGFNLVGIFKAINNGPSVSALGYDYLIGLAIAWLWFWMVGDEWK